LNEGDDWMQEKEKKKAPADKKRRLTKVLIADMALLLVALFWGAGFVVTKNILTQVGPFYFLGIRFTLAALILLIIFNKRIRKVDLLTFKKGMIIGSFLFMGFATQTVGLLYTTPARQGFITGTNVVMVPFIYMLFSGEKVGKGAVFGALMTSVGLAVISLQQGVMGFNLGDSLTLACALFFASHIVAIGILVKKADPINLTIIQLALTGIFSLIIAVIFEPIPQISFNVGVMGIGYMVIFSSIAAFLIQNIAQTFTFPTHAAILLSLESVFGAIFSAVFWGENLTIKFVIGAFIILTGIIITEIKPVKKSSKVS
jgi:drug/metabolite transporter (DMT)-like permease